jgi:hypothetical protein
MIASARLFQTADRGTKICSAETFHCVDRAIPADREHSYRRYYVRVDYDGSSHVTHATMRTFSHHNNLLKVNGWRPAPFSEAPKFQVMRSGTLRSTTGPWRCLRAAEVTPRTRARCHRRLVPAISLGARQSSKSQPLVGTQNGLWIELARSGESIGDGRRNPPPAAAWCRQVRQTTMRLLSASFKQRIASHALQGTTPLTSAGSPGGSTSIAVEAKIEAGSRAERRCAT